MKYIFLILLAFVAKPLLAQQDTTGRGNITVHVDPRVDLLVRKQIEINEFTTRDARRFASGYRILVISTNDRAKAINAKTKVYQQYPELKAYLMYQAPYFRLKVGNFRDQKEAESYLNDLKTLFPGNMYIVRDTIEVNPEPSEM